MAEHHYTGVEIRAYVYGDRKCKLMDRHLDDCAHCLQTMMREIFKLTQQRQSDGAS